MPRSGYSQNDEEAAISAVWGNRPAGRFLDIGAHDGITFSNTRRLFELGWSGTLVEPSPAPFCKLMEAYRDAPQCKLVHVAIVPGSSNVEILEMQDSHGDFVSTFDAKHQALWQKGGVAFQPIQVAGFAIDLFLERFAGPYQFVNLDVEGINWQIFRDLPLRALETEIVCVEYQDKRKEIEAHAAAQGFGLFHVTSENLVLVKR